MRFARTLLLLVTLLAAQVHACATVFLCSDGNVCTTCTGLSAPEESVGDPAECTVADLCGQATDERSCQECCQIAADEPGHESQYQRLGTLELGVAVLPPAEIELPSAPLLIDRQLPSLLGCGMPHAPPGAASSRAPPTLPA